MDPRSPPDPRTKTLIQGLNRPIQLLDPAGSLPRRPTIADSAAFGMPLTWASERTRLGNSRSVHRDALVANREISSEIRANRYPDDDDLSVSSRPSWIGSAPWAMGCREAATKIRTVTRESPLTAPPHRTRRSPARIRLRYPCLRKTRFDHLPRPVGPVRHRETPGPRGCMDTPHSPRRARSGQTQR